MFPFGDHVSLAPGREVGESARSAKKIDRWHHQGVLKVLKKAVAQTLTTANLPSQQIAFWAIFGPFWVGLLWI